MKRSSITAAAKGAGELCDIIIACLGPDVVLTVLDPSGLSRLDDLEAEP